MTSTSQYHKLSYTLNIFPWKKNIKQTKNMLAKSALNVSLIAFENNAHCTVYEIFPSTSCLACLFLYSACLYLDSVCLCLYSVFLYPFFAYLSLCPVPHFSCSAPLCLCYVSPLFVVWFAELWAWLSSRLHLPDSLDQHLPLVSIKFKCLVMFLWDSMVKEYNLYRI